MFGCAFSAWPDSSPGSDEGLAVKMTEYQLREFSLFSREVSALQGGLQHS